MSEDYDGCQYVGMDLHRRRSVLVRMDAAGRRLETVRIVNDLDRLAEVISRAGPAPEVVLEATYGWYWAADALAELGAVVHLPHPLGVKGFDYRRVKNDERDAADLADLLRMGRLPEGWIAPPDTREIRQVVRHRAKLVHLRTGVREQVHAILANEGVAIAVSDLFGVAGNHLLDQVALSPVARARIVSLRRLLDQLDGEIDAFHKLATRRLHGDARYRAVQTIPGIGPVLGAVFVPRSGTSPASAARRNWPAGPGSRPSTVNPIRPCVAAGSPNKAASWSAGPPSKPPTAPARTPAPASAGIASAPGAAATSGSPPQPATCSRWSTTHCVTGRSDASPNTGNPLEITAGCGPPCV